MAQFCKTREEINEVIDECSELIDNGVSKYPRMSYEEGIKAAPEWAFGDIDEHPMA